MRGAAHPKSMLTHSIADNEVVKAEVFEKVGDLSDVDLFHNRILVATFVRPEKTASGIILADITRKEDEYQGAVGVVLKKGPGAFVDAGGVEFFGKDVEVGQWVVYSMRSGRGMSLNGVHCRVLEDAHIDMVIPRPDMVF